MRLQLKIPRGGVNFWDVSELFNGWELPAVKLCVVEREGKIQVEREGKI